MPKKVVKPTEIEGSGNTTSNFHINTIFIPPV